MRKMTLAAAAAFAAISTAAFATVTFDPNTGTGFVGKGDVQTALGLNNAQAQALGNPTFTYQGTTEVSWTCTKIVELGNGGTNDIVQQRANVTTTYGLISSEARTRNQITGYNLLGFGAPVSTSTDGPTVGSCPATPSGFTYDNNATSNSTGGGLYVNGVLLQ